MPQTVTLTNAAAMNGPAPALASTYEQLCALRHSTRAYLGTPVANALLERLLTSARKAPSGANLQPGQLVQVNGNARLRLSQALTQAFLNQQHEDEDYSYFPDPLASVYRRRQVAAARALYGALGIERDNRSARDVQFARNFHFFDAPVALLVTIDRNMGSGCYMDLGMALYGLMLAAQAHGLASCAIGALAAYPGLIRRTLPIADDQAIVCGIALGYADPSAAVNQTTTERVELDHFFRTISD